MFPLLVTFFLISLTGALAPGPLTTMAIVEGSRRGKWSGLRLAAGHGLVEGSYVALIALVLWLGRESLLRQPLVTGLIALIGGVFLAWLKRCKGANNLAFKIIGVFFDILGHLIDLAPGHKLAQSIHPYLNG